jgi:hypothetical protein
MTCWYLSHSWALALFQSKTAHALAFVYVSQLALMPYKDKGTITSQGTLGLKGKTQYC